MTLVQICAGFDLQTKDWIEVWSQDFRLADRRVPIESRDQTLNSCSSSCDFRQGLDVLRKLMEVGCNQVESSFLHHSVALLRLYPQVRIERLHIALHLHRAQFEQLRLLSVVVVAPREIYKFLT
jgi:hypothetical protein